MSNERGDIARLLSIMSKLRDPITGCPWDNKQSFETLAPYTIEEAYEVVDAIASGNTAHIKEECGDLLFQVVFYAQLAQEDGSFSFLDIVNSLSEKLIRRHPHVFEKQMPMSTAELESQWERIKSEERVSKNNVLSPTVFSSVPSGLPSLMYAYKLQGACAKVGFDWPEAQPVLEKVKEEILEIEEAMAQNDNDAIEEEIGDALFALVNLARHKSIDADYALRKASHKFKSRFEQVEAIFSDEKRDLSATSLEELEIAWQTVKKTHG